MFYNDADGRFIDPKRICLKYTFLVVIGLDFESIFVKSISKNRSVLKIKDY